MKKLIFLVLVVVIGVVGCDFDYVDIESKKHILTYKVYGDTSGGTILFVDRDENIYIEGSKKNIEYSFEFDETEHIYYEVRINNITEDDPSAFFGPFLQVTIDNEFEVSYKCEIGSYYCRIIGHYK